MLDVRACNSLPTRISESVAKIWLAKIAFGDIHSAAGDVDSHSAGIPGGVAGRLCGEKVDSLASISIST